MLETSTMGTSRINGMLRTFAFIAIAALSLTGVAHAAEARRLR